MKIFKLSGLLVVFVAGISAPSIALAGGWTNPAVPSNVQIVRTEGFLIAGPFGNPGPCGNADYIWISATHPQYKELLSTALTALGGGLKLTAYVHSCSVVSWWSAATIGELSSSGALMVSR